jgi:hypothetical protein
MRLLYSFLKRNLPEAAGFTGRFRMQALKGDGSDRKVFRVFSGKKTHVAVAHPQGRQGRPSENASFFYIGTHLRSKGLPTPAILAFDRRRGFFLLEDFGDLSLETRVKGLKDPEQVKILYQQLITLLIRIQREGAEGFDSRRCYDTPLYNSRFSWERESRYFLEAFLQNYCRWKKPTQGLEEELTRLASLVDQERSRVFLYRDFQSRNIMMAGNGFGLIDFQAGRLGPPQYDLASLLIDPYVDLPEELQEELLDFYISSWSQKISLDPSAFRRHYEIMAFQRNLQILGAFAFLTRVKGKVYFEAFIPPALSGLKKRVQGDLFKPFVALKRLLEEL